MQVIFTVNLVSALQNKIVILANFWVATVVWHSFPS